MWNKWAKALFICVFNANTNSEYTITYKSVRFMNLKLQAGVFRKVAIKNGKQAFMKMFVFVSFDVSYSYHCVAEFGFFLSWPTSVTFPPPRGRGGKDYSSAENFVLSY